MSKFKVKLLTKPDQVREAKPEELERIYCRKCEASNILQIKEAGEKKKKKEEVKEEVVGNSISKPSMDVQKEKEWAKKQVEEAEKTVMVSKEPTIKEVREEVNRMLREPVPTMLNPMFDTIKHEHNIKISLPAMIFSTLSLIIMILLLKFI